MKISIIMVAKNSYPFINEAIQSFKLQNYSNKELIIVFDENSEDNTGYYLKNLNDRNIKKFICTKGLYKSINFGIRKSSGDIIGILHTDDVYFNEKVLTNIAKTFEVEKSDYIFSNILYSNKLCLDKINRKWDNIKIDPNKFLIGPHTGFYIKSNIAKKNLYNTSYKISADSDFLIKICKKKLKGTILNKFTTIMRTGGLSTSFKNIFIKFYEDYNIAKNNNIKFHFIILKILSKLNQFLYNEKLSNIFLKKIIQNKYRIISPNKIFNFKSFIYSGLNLAYFGYEKKYPNIYHPNSLFWHDGIFSSFKKKIPGHKILKSILKQLNHKNMNIYFFGNLNSKNKDWLKLNLKKNYIHVPLPYGSINKIKNFLKNYKIKNNSCLIMNLPTPKQELISIFLTNRFRYTKMINTGAALNIISGAEKKAPSFITSIGLEWLWRMQSDPIRRSKRLILSLFYYLFY